MVVLEEEEEGFFVAWEEEKEPTLKMLELSEIDDDGSSGEQPKLAVVEGEEEVGVAKEGQALKLKSGEEEEVGVEKEGEVWELKPKTGEEDEEVGVAKEGEELEPKGEELKGPETPRPNILSHTLPIILRFASSSSKHAHTEKRKGRRSRERKEKDAKSQRELSSTFPSTYVPVFF